MVVTYPASRSLSIFLDKSGRSRRDILHNKHTKSFLAARVLDVTFFTGVFGEPKIPDEFHTGIAWIELDH